MDQKRIVAGIDIGTTKICAIITEVTPENNMEIIGIGLASSQGLRKGIVVDIDKTSNAINEAVKKAERMAGIRIDSAYVGIAGSHIRSVNSHGVVAVTGSEKEIKQSDIDRVIEAAQIIPLSAEEEIIHVLARQFIVDGCEGIKDPYGMSGVRLEVDAHIVTGATASVQNLVKSVLKAGLDVDDIVLEPLASSKAVLSEDEKELGVALVDMGGGTTDFVVFHDGSISYTSVLPVGGNHVSNDIAVGLRTPVSEAEKIKIRHGCAIANNVGEEEYIEVMAASGQKKNNISRRVLCEVIEPRMQEIFTMVGDEFSEAGPRDLTPAGVVLTGGASMLADVTELAAKILDLPVRLGEPGEFSGLSQTVDNPLYVEEGKQIPKAIFSTAVGLIKYGASCKNVEQSNTSSELVNKFFRRIKNWFNDFF